MVLPLIKQVHYLAISHPKIHKNSPHQHLAMSFQLIDEEPHFLGFVTAETHGNEVT
jgi:hypothetical protein